PAPARCHRRRREAPAAVDLGDASPPSRRGAPDEAHRPSVSLPHRPTGLCRVQQDSDGAAPHVLGGPPPPPPLCITAAAPPPSTSENRHFLSTKRHTAALRHLLTAQPASPHRLRRAPPSPFFVLSLSPPSRRSVLIAVTTSLHALRQKASRPVPLELDKSAVFFRHGALGGGAPPITHKTIPNDDLFRAAKSHSTMAALASAPSSESFRFALAATAKCDGKGGPAT
ncbi:MAG: hypothetical protein BJ554DRAFT_2064, partial [Olpidium bornovanus]